MCCKAFGAEITREFKNYRVICQEHYEDIAIRNCKDRNVLKEYLESKETEVVTIMMSLFDDEKIMKTALKSERHEEARETAVRMFTDREPIEKIARYLPILSLEELKEIEAEVMQSV